MSAALKLTSAEEKLAASLPDGELAEALRAHGLPNRRVEQWKWSDLRAVMKEARAPSIPLAAESIPSFDALKEVAGTNIILGNGVLRDAASLPAGLTVTQLEAEPILWPDLPVASLATSATRLVITITQTLEAPIILRRVSRGDGSHADRVLINIADGVKATIIETHELADTVFANSLTELSVGQGAEVTRLVLQSGVDDAVSVHTSRLSVAQDAKLHQLCLSGGGAFSRQETHLDYQGTAEVRLDGLYRLNGKRHHDMTTQVRHDVPDAVTRQLVKGIVDDQARGIFQGKFYVAQEGQQTDAQMAHHALVLSGEAAVNAKPELEIYADDVECAHGNTVGALDAEALFYLRQRGLDERQARHMLTHAFAAEVFDEVEDDPLRQALHLYAQESLI